MGHHNNNASLSVEQKLELSHRLRQENDYNRLQMNRREELVYGKLFRGKSAMLRAAQDDKEKEEASYEQRYLKERRRNRRSLLFRSFTAVLLLVIVLLMKFENLEIAGIDYQNLIASLQSKEFINGIDFESLIPYTDREQEGEGFEGTDAVR